MGCSSEPITDEDYRIAVAEALRDASIWFTLAEGPVAHIRQAESEDRKRRPRRQRRRAQNALHADVYPQ